MPGERSAAAFSAPLCLVQSPRPQCGGARWARGMPGALLAAAAPVGWAPRRENVEESHVHPPSGGVQGERWARLSPAQGPELQAPWLGDD